MPFGPKQIFKATPEKVKEIRNSLIYFIGGCSAFAMLFVPKLKITGEEYAMYIGFAILLQILLLHYSELNPMI